MTLPSSSTSLKITPDTAISSPFSEIYLVLFVQSNQCTSIENLLTQVLANRQKFTHWICSRTIFLTISACMSLSVCSRQSRSSRQTQPHAMFTSNSQSSVQPDKKSSGKQIEDTTPTTWVGVIRLWVVQVRKACGSPARSEPVKYFLKRKIIVDSLY